MSEPEEPLPPVAPGIEYPTLAQSVMVLTVTLAWIVAIGILFEKCHFAKPVALFIETIALSAPALVWALQSKLPFNRIFRFQYPGWRHILLAVPFGMGASVVIDALDRWWSLLVKSDAAFEKQMLESLRTNTTTEMVLVILGIAVVTPIVEEMLFRGMLQGSLESRSSSASAVVWTAAIFGFFHFNFSQLPSLFLIGIVLGLVVWRVDSILPSVVIHGVNNGLSYSSMNRPDTELFRGYLQGHFVALPWLLAAIVLTSVSAYAYFRFSDETISEPMV